MAYLLIEATRIGFKLFCLLDLMAVTITLDCVLCERGSVYNNELQSLLMNEMMLKCNGEMKCNEQKGSKITLAETFVFPTSEASLLYVLNARAQFLSQSISS